MVGVSARAGGAPTALATPVPKASRRYGHSDEAPPIVTRRSPKMTATSTNADAAKSDRRGNRSARWPAGQREQRQRQELGEADEAEVERVPVQLVDLPADRDLAHRQRQPGGDGREPEEPEVPDAQRGPAAAPRPRRGTRHSATAASAWAAGSANSTSSRPMRVPSVSSTVKRRPFELTSSPGSAWRPSSPKTKPAIVW